MFQVQIVGPDSLQYLSTSLLLVVCLHWWNRRQRRQLEHFKHFGFVILDKLDCSRVRNEVGTIRNIGACIHYDMSVITIMRMLWFVHSVGETSDGWIEM
jgi:hypothetical protein